MGTQWYPKSPPFFIIIIIIVVKAEIILITFLTIETSSTIYTSTTYPYSRGNLAPHQLWRWAIGIYIYIYKGTDDLRSCNDTRQADFRVQAGLAKDNLVLRLRNIALSAALENWILHHDYKVMKPSPSISSASVSALSSIETSLE